VPLLNYTTTVPARRTASQIMDILAKHGAQQILVDYSGDGAGAVNGLAFAIQTDHGLMRYKLPVDIAAVEKVLRADRAVAPRLKNEEHAERVAWRILKDWIEAQLALISTRMVTLDQVMLPYMIMGEGTVYELYRNQQLAITAGSDR
jgi:hypothetical protein